MEAETRAKNWVCLEMTDIPRENIASLAALLREVEAPLKAEIERLREDIRLRDIDCGCNARVTELQARVRTLEDALRDLMESDLDPVGWVRAKKRARAVLRGEKPKQGIDDEGVDPYNCGIGGAMDRALREEGKP